MTNQEIDCPFENLEFQKLSSSSSQCAADHLLFRGSKLCRDVSDMDHIISSLTNTHSNNSYKKDSGELSLNSGNVVVDTVPKIFVQTNSYTDNLPPHDDSHQCASFIHKIVSNAKTILGTRCNALHPSSCSEEPTRETDNCQDDTNDTLSIQSKFLELKSFTKYTPSDYCLCDVETQDDSSKVESTITIESFPKEREETTSISKRTSVDYSVLCQPSRTQRSKEALESLISCTSSSPINATTTPPNSGGTIEESSTTTTTTPLEKERAQRSKCCNTANFFRGDGNFNSVSRYYDCRSDVNCYVDGRDVLYVRKNPQAHQIPEESVYQSACTSESIATPATADVETQKSTNSSKKMFSLLDTTWLNPFRREQSKQVNTVQQSEAAQNTLNIPCRDVACHKNNGVTETRSASVESKPVADHSTIVGGHHSRGATANLDTYRNMGDVKRVKAQSCDRCSEAHCKLMHLKAPQKQLVSTACSPILRNDIDNKNCRKCNPNCPVCSLRSSSATTRRQPPKCREHMHPRIPSPETLHSVPRCEHMRRRSPLPTLPHIDEVDSRQSGSQATYQQLADDHYATRRHQETVRQQLQQSADICADISAGNVRSTAKPSVIFVDTAAGSNTARTVFIDTPVEVEESVLLKQSNPPKFEEEFLEGSEDTSNTVSRQETQGSSLSCQLSLMSFKPSKGSCNLSCLSDNFLIRNNSCSSNKFGSSRKKLEKRKRNFQTNSLSPKRARANYLKDEDNQCAFIGSPVLNRSAFRGRNVEKTYNVCSSPPSSHYAFDLSSKPTNSNATGFKKIEKTCSPSLSIDDSEKFTAYEDLTSNADRFRLEFDRIRRESGLGEPFVVVSNLPSLEHQSRTSDRGFQRVPERISYLSCPPGVGNGANDKLDRLTRELKTENQVLKSELLEMKMELKHALEKVEGPMRSKLEAEKFRCEQLHQDLQRASIDMKLSHDSFEKESHDLKLQLSMACSNMSQLEIINKRLRDEMTALDNMCAKLEVDLVNQKLNEAEMLKRLTKRTMGTKAVIIAQSSTDTRLDGSINLNDIARKLSKTLKETIPCEDCSKLPVLTGAAKMIKDLTDMVDQKRNADILSLETTSISRINCSCQSPPETEDTGCQYQAMADIGIEVSKSLFPYVVPSLPPDTKTTKTLFHVPDNFMADGDSSRHIVDEKLTPSPPPSGPMRAELVDRFNAIASMRNQCTDPKTADKKINYDPPRYSLAQPLMVDKEVNFDDARDPCQGDTATYARVDKQVDYDAAAGRVTVVESLLIDEDVDFDYGKGDCDINTDPNKVLTCYVVKTSVCPVSKQPRAPPQTQDKAMPPTMKDEATHAVGNQDCRNMERPPCEIIGLPCVNNVSSAYVSCEGFDKLQGFDKEKAARDNGKSRNARDYNRGGDAQTKEGSTNHDPRAPCKDIGIPCARKRSVKFMCESMESPPCDSIGKPCTKNKKCNVKMEDVSAKNLETMSAQEQRKLQDKSQKGNEFSTSTDIRPCSCGGIRKGKQYDKAKLVPDRYENIPPYGDPRYKDANIGDKLDTRYGQSQYKDSDGPLHSDPLYKDANIGDKLDTRHGESQYEGSDGLRYKDANVGDKLVATHGQSQYEDSDGPPHSDTRYKDANVGDKLDATHGQSQYEDSDGLPYGDSRYKDANIGDKLDATHGQSQYEDSDGPPHSDSGYKDASVADKLDATHGQSQYKDSDGPPHSDSRYKDANVGDKPDARDVKVGDRLSAKDASSGDPTSSKDASVGEKYSLVDAGINEKPSTKDADIGDTIGFQKDSAVEAKIEVDAQDGDTIEEICPATAGKIPRDPSKKQIVVLCRESGPCVDIGRPCQRFVQNESGTGPSTAHEFDDTPRVYDGRSTSTRTDEEVRSTQVQLKELVTSVNAGIDPLYAQRGEAPYSAIPSYTGYQDTQTETKDSTHLASGSYEAPCASIGIPCFTGSRDPQSPGKGSVHSASGSYEAPCASIGIPCFTGNRDPQSPGKGSVHSASGSYEAPCASIGIPCFTGYQDPQSPGKGSVDLASGSYEAPCAAIGIPCFTGNQDSQAQIKESVQVVTSGNDATTVDTEHKDTQAEIKKSAQLVSEGNDAPCYPICSTKFTDTQDTQVQDSQAQVKESVLLVNSSSDPPDVGVEHKDTQVKESTQLVSGGNDAPCAEFGTPCAAKHSMGTQDDRMVCHAACSTQDESVDPPQDTSTQSDQQAKSKDATEGTVAVIPCASIGVPCKMFASTGVAPCTENLPCSIQTDTPRYDPSTKLIEEMEFDTISSEAETRTEEGIHLITTSVQDGNLEVTTEGSSGYIETRLSLLPDGALEVQTEINETEGAARKPRPVSSEAKREFEEERKKLQDPQTSLTSGPSGLTDIDVSSGIEQELPRPIVICPATGQPCAAGICVPTVCAAPTDQRKVPAVDRSFAETQSRDLQDRSITTVEQPTVDRIILAEPSIQTTGTHASVEQEEKMTKLSSEMTPLVDEQLETSEDTKHSPVSVEDLTVSTPQQTSKVELSSRSVGEEDTKATVASSTLPIEMDTKGEDTDRPVDQEISSEPELVLEQESETIRPRQENTSTSFDRERADVGIVVKPDTKERHASKQSEICQSTKDCQSINSNTEQSCQCCECNEIGVSTGECFSEELTLETPDMIPDKIPVKDSKPLSVKTTDDEFHSALDEKSTDEHDTRPDSTPIGSDIRSDGSLQQGDGKIKSSHEAIQSAGSIRPSGASTGSKILSNGDISGPDGTSQPDASIVGPDGTFIYTSGGLPPDESKKMSDGNVEGPDVSVERSDGIVLDADGTVTMPDGSSVSRGVTRESKQSLRDTGVDVISIGDVPIDRVEKIDDLTKGGNIFKEVPDLVSTLSSQGVPPTQYSSEVAGAPVCTCLGKCNCILCASNIMEQRKQEECLAACRRSGGRSYGTATERMSHSADERRSKTPDNFTDDPCRCKYGQRQTPVKPHGKRECEAFLTITEYEKMRANSKTKPKVTVDDVFKPTPRLDCSTMRTKPCRSKFKHGSECECVDCLCSPVIRDLIHTRQLPNVPNNKQIYQVSNIKCACPNTRSRGSKIPVSTNPAVPKVKSSGAEISCTCDPCECSPCADQDRNTYSSNLPTSEQIMRMTPEQLKELCDCDPCQCEICYSKYLTDDEAEEGGAICCCKPGCVCELCQVEDMKQQIEQLRQEIEALKTPKVDHPADCDCDICKCPLGPNRELLMPPEEGPGLDDEDCTCTTCDCPLGPNKDKAPPKKKWEHPADCDCEICTCPLAPAGGDMPEGCSCGTWCTCPGGPHAGKKMPMKNCNCKPPCLCPGGPIPQCDCNPECKCSPCGDPRKRPKFPVPECDCTPCLCSPCVDPRLAPPKEHPENCTCPECICADPQEPPPAHPENCKCAECACEEPAPPHPEGCTCETCQCDEGVEEPHPEDCICDKCKCVPEDELGVPTCDCVVCECAADILGTVHPEGCICDLCKCDNLQLDHPDGCTCPLCECEDPTVHPDDCTCELCKCDEEQPPAHPDGCTCDTCICGDTHPEGCTCEICKCDEEPEITHPEGCTCELCICDEKQRLGHPEGCTCDVCKCDEEQRPGHPEGCTCDLCKCDEEQRPGHPEGCICELCKCDDEKRPGHPEGCICELCKCDEEQPPAHPEGCTCGICVCPEEPPAEPTHPEGCICDTCSCQPKPEPVKCICPVCVCAEKQPECPCNPCKCEQQTATMGQTICTCDVCTCDQGDIAAAKVQTEDAAMSTLVGKATHAMACVCAECTCPDPAGDGQDAEAIGAKENKCVCTDCKCPDCFFRTLAAPHPDGCCCPACKCIECKADATAVDECLCPICKCVPCIHQSNQTFKCKCGVCICIECQDKGGKGASIAAPAQDKEAKEEAVKQAGPLPANRSCHCINCYCDDCSNDKKQGSAARPQIKIDVPPPDTEVAAARAARGDSERKCTCMKCICVDCIMKKTAAEPVKAAGGGEYKDCSCPKCLCADCGEGAPCQLDICTCDTCNMKKKPPAPPADCTTVSNVVLAKPDMKDVQCASAPQKIDAECHCATCQCEACKAKNQTAAGDHHPDCKCVQCLCAACNDIPITKEAECYCELCKCLDCITKGKEGGGEAPPFELPRKLSCDCQNCQCVICSVKGGGGAADDTPPPPFTLPQRISCTCETCTCPANCKADGERCQCKIKDQPPVIEIAPVIEKVCCGVCGCKQKPSVDGCMCNASKGGGGGVAIENRPKGGAAAVMSVVPPAFQTRIAPLAQPGRLPCLCGNCQCALYGKRGSIIISTPAGDVFEAQLGQTCHCDNCGCPLCAKFTSTSFRGSSGTGSRPQTAPEGNSTGSTTCATSPSDNFCSAKSACSSRSRCPDCSGELSSQMSTQVGGSSMCRTFTKIGTTNANLQESTASVTHSKYNQTACACVSCPDTSRKAEAGNQFQSKSICAECCLADVDLSDKDNATLKRQIENDKKESCACKRQIKEIKSALSSIKSACSDAERKPIKQPLVKSASTFSQTMSGLKLALINLQEKCKAKDKMIEVMTGELKNRASSQTLLKVLNTCTGDAPDYDKTEDVREKSGFLSPLGEERNSFDEKVAIAVESERGHHKRKRSKSCKCGKIHRKEHRSVDLSGFEVVDIRRITHDSIIIKWRPPRSNVVTGYDIFINGVNKSKVMSGGRTSAMVHSIDLSATIQITIYAVTKCGRCEPPAIAIYEIRSQK